MNVLTINVLINRVGTMTETNQKTDLNQTQIHNKKEY
jgi:hypothetical protein